MNDTDKGIWERAYFAALTGLCNKEVGGVSEDGRIWSIVENVTSDAADIADATVKLFRDRTRE